MITQKPQALTDLGASLFILLVGIFSFLHVLNLPMTALDAYPIIAAAQVENIWDLPSVWVRELRDRIHPGVSYYRPLTLSTYSIDWLIWKLDPRGYQLTDLALHALAGMAVFWLFRVGLAMRTFWATVASLLFLLHPATVEVVPAVTRRQEPLLVLGFVVTILGARGVLAKKRSAWTVLLAGTIMSVTCVERGLMVPAVVFAYFFAFGEKRDLLSRARFSILHAVPSAALALGFYVLRSALFEDSRVVFRATNLVRVPTITGLRTFYPQEFLGSLREDSPLTDLVFATIAGLVIGGLVLWVALKSAERRKHFFTAFSATSYVLLFTIAGIVNTWYAYTIVPFVAFSLSSLLEEGIRSARSESRMRGATSVLISLVLIALFMIPSPLFFEYKGWRIAGELGENFLSEIRKVTESLPGDVAVVAINTPAGYVDSTADFVETRSATILFPKSVRAWARISDIQHRIVIFGVSHFEGEFTTPKIDFPREGVVRIHFASDRAEYIPLTDHARRVGESGRSWELLWPPQDLESERFEVYVFDGRKLVRLDVNGAGSSTE